MLHHVFHLFVNVKLCELLKNIFMKEIKIICIFINFIDLLFFCQHCPEKIKFIIIEKVIHELRNPFRIIIEELIRNKGFRLKYFALTLDFFLVKVLRIHFMSLIKFLVCEIIKMSHSKFKVFIIYFFYLFLKFFEILLKNLLPIVFFLRRIIRLVIILFELQKK